MNDSNSRKDVKYFFTNREGEKEKVEKAYDTWMSENKSGFVVNGYLDEERERIWTATDRGDKRAKPILRMHKATCKTLNKEEDINVRCRTRDYGKLCSLDESSLIEDCKSRGHDISLRLCKARGQNCFS